VRCSSQRETSQRRLIRPTYLERNAKHEFAYLKSQMPRFSRKFTGAKAQLFATGCAEYSRVAEAGYNDTPEEHPVFSRLSPNQRLKLVSEVAVGLLVPKEPLPPDTFQHYAAFLGVVDCIRNGLVMEMESVYDGCVGEDFVEEYYEKRTQSGSQRTRTPEEQETWQVERALLEKAARKQKRKLEKNQSSEISDEETAFKAQPPDLGGYLEMRSKRLQLLFEGGPCSDREPSRPLTDVEKSNGFRWRLLCDAAFQEDVLGSPLPFNLALPSLSGINFCWHCYDSEKWSHAIDHLLISKYFVDISEEEHALQSEPIDLASYADCNQHARIREVERIVKEVREPYEATWDGSRNAEDQRLIFAICDTRLHYGVGHGPFAVEFEKQCLTGGFGLKAKDMYQERFEIYTSIKDNFTEGLEEGFNDGMLGSNPAAYKFRDGIDFKMCNGPNHPFSFTEKEELMKCARCRVVNYCSKQCQKDDWKAHKAACKNLAIWKKDQDKISEVAMKH